MGIGIRQGTATAGMKVTGAARRTKAPTGSGHIIKAECFIRAIGTAAVAGSTTITAGTVTGIATGVTIDTIGTITAS